MNPRFSICIPNYNYEQYLPLTFDSVLLQSYKDYEICVVDNASTDNSQSIIIDYASKHSRIHSHFNKTNIGFAGNLDKVGALAIGEWMIMLSSDDLMTPDSLKEYNRFIQLIPNFEKFFFCSGFEKIDSDGKFLEWIGPKDRTIWHKEDIDYTLSNSVGYDVYKVTAEEMLHRCLTSYLNPMNFAATCYPKKNYEQVEGYSGGRLVNPDKWFHLKLLAEMEYVYMLDKPLFKYRWHSSNQTAIQEKSKVLSYWIDEYRNTIELTDKMLEKAGLSRIESAKVFIQKVIIAYTWKMCLDGKPQMAKRIFNFGKSCYPALLKSNNYYSLCLLLIHFNFLRYLIKK